MININKNNADYENVIININQDVIDAYKGNVPFDYLIKASMYTDTDIGELEQYYWIRLYFKVENGTEKLVDWKHLKVFDEIDELEEIASSLSFEIKEV